MHVWHDRALDPTSSDWGRRQQYLEGARRKVEVYIIDVDGFPVNTDKEAQTYWQWLKPGALFDAPAYLDPSDMPADPKMVFDAWEREPLVEPEAAADTVKNLLDEANALREWTIPPRAHVDLRIGPFVSVELTEVGDEIYFVWRLPDSRYRQTSVSVRTQAFDDDMFLNPELHGPRAAVRLLMAALIRDFWVVEERHSIFDVRVERAPLASGKPKRAPRVIYLPHVRYTSGGMRLGRLSDGLQHSMRARHYVRPFFRKVERPSLLQLEIAQRHRISLPPGHTYVRGHYRGGGERQAVYRSRSALNLLYEIVSPPALNSAPIAEDWFAFERAIATLLENNLDFTILDRAVRGRGDQGVDILATKLVDGRVELWVVQCKHDADSNAVGPAIIRELLGSVMTVRHEDGQAVRGMLVTTGRITDDALKLAASHGVQTYDGIQLAAIYAAINREQAPQPPDVERYFESE